MGPRSLSGTDCSAGQNQGTRSRLCSGGGEEIAQNLHKALGVFTLRCHSKAEWVGGGEDGAQPWPWAPGVGGPSLDFGPWNAAPCTPAAKC